MPRKTTAKPKEKTMTKNDLRDLHQFVKDTQANTIVEAVTNTSAQLTEEQTRLLIAAVSAKTDECFFRFMDKF